MAEYDRLGSLARAVDSITGHGEISVKDEPENDYKSISTTITNDQEAYVANLEPKVKKEQDGETLSCRCCNDTTATSEQINGHVAKLGSALPCDKDGFVQVDAMLQGKGIKQEMCVTDLVMEKSDANNLVMSESQEACQARVHSPRSLGIVFYTSLPPSGIKTEPNGFKTEPNGIKKEPVESDEGESYFFCLMCGYVSGDQNEVKEHCVDTHGDRSVPCFICCEKNEGGVFASSVHEFSGKYSSMKVKDQGSVPNYICQVCGMRHFYSAYVRRHILSQHGQHLRKPYRCVPCKFACFEYPHLIHHIKGKHPNRDYGTRIDQAHMKAMKDFLMSTSRIVQVKAPEIEQICENICVFAAIESLTCSCDEPDASDASTTPASRDLPMASLAKSKNISDEEKEYNNDDSGSEWEASSVKRCRVGKGYRMQVKSAGDRWAVPRGGRTAAAAGSRGIDSTNTSNGIQHVIRAKGRGSRGDTLDQTVSSLATAVQNDESHFFYCVACGFISKIKNNVSAHIMTHHSGGIYTCMLCDEVYKIQHPGVGDAKHSYTQTLGTLDVSVYKHTGKMPIYTCPFAPECEYHHVIRLCMQKHIALAHSASKSMPYQCQYCNFSCLEHKYLQHHHAVKHLDQRGPYLGIKVIGLKLRGPKTKFMAIEDVESMVRTQHIRSWNFHPIKPSDIDIKTEPS